jgi:prophage regulatory protein
MSDAFLRLPQVKIRVGLSRSSIYMAISQGKFPRPVRLGLRAVGWLESEIEAWVLRQVELSRRCL